MLVYCLLLVVFRDSVLFWLRLNMFQLSLSALCLALLMQCTVAQEQATEHICKRDGTQITGDTSSVQGSFSNAVDTCQASPACTGLTYVPGEGYHLKSGTFVEIVDLLSGIASYLRVCLEDYARQQQVESSTPGVNSLAFDPSNRLWIAAGTATGSVKTWFRTRQKSEATRHVGAVQSVQFSPAGNGVLASAGDDMNVHLTDRSSGALVGTLPCVDSSGAPRVRSPIHALAYSPDGASIAAGCADGSIWQFNTAGTCELIGLGGGGEDLSAKLRVQGGGPYYYGPPVTALAYMPRGGGLIVGVGTEVEVWDVAAKLRRMSGWHGGSITAVAWYGVHQRLNQPVPPPPPHSTVCPTLYTALCTSLHTSLCAVLCPSLRAGPPPFRAPLLLVRSTSYTTLPNALCTTLTMY